MTLTVINDLHIGAIRAAGTTPQTAFQLRQDLLAGLRTLLNTAGASDILVNGDLFDTGNIPMYDLGEAVRIFGTWLTNYPNQKLYLSRGNHDITKNSTVLSSFDFFGQLLSDLFTGRVHVITQLTEIQPGYWVLPHVDNQDLFDMALKEVPECDYLFVHANYDNGFAACSDHSLNMSKEQARECKAKTIIFGHEHQAGQHLDGKVLIIGNQTPSSVSDCLGNDHKAYLVITGYSTKLVPCWQAEGDFSEQDWRSLEDRGRFVRVTGHATAAEADAVVTAISRFRREAKALVITNAVKIEGVDNAAELALTHEAIETFDVLSALLKILSPDEGAKITKLLEGENGSQKS